ncbi:MAG: tellurite resistance TerB family protein [gamma proteobacterium symbiont of Bathyaustriella thionipta]|nr:tellurite resistance TerB family protein [gamma proteobacterium symbiont of Bathyaustriella thionipta]MCU7956157.1 tellurite resistance TerB family protein [gamma proteobacterium symbiont of Bathyaustriella thionipta]
MFDAQNLLGSLLKEVVSGKKSGSGLGSKAALGMGAIGVAIAAFEHFTQEKNTPVKNVANGSRPLSSSGTRTETIKDSTAAPPPPPPSMSTASAVPPPVPSSAFSKGRKVFQDTALLLIDAMLAAANADGNIDADEKSKIIQQLKQINSDQEGFEYLQKRIDNPPSLENICDSVSDPETAKQVYMVSLLAITVDTADEAEYLSSLAACLAIDVKTIEQLNE